MEQKKKRVIYPLLIIIPILVTPFLLLISIDRLQYLKSDIFSIFYDVLDSFGGTMANLGAMPAFLILFLVTVFTVFVATALLFEIKILKIENDVRKSRFWRFISFFIVKERHWWHIMLGYFLILVMLAPVISENVRAIQEGLSGITNFQGDFLTSVFLVPVLIIVRILSKLDIEIMRSDIGSFIILVYVSEIIFSVFSGSQIPFEYLYGLVTKSTSEVQGFVMLYGSVVVGTFVCTFVDCVIMWKWKKPL